MLSRCLRGHNLIKEGDLNEMITKFKDNIKTLLISDFVAVAGFTNERSFYLSI